MPAYTGPVPPTPGQAATDAQWQNWTAFQIMLQNMRYEDERIARAAVTDRQHAEKMQRDDKCAAATIELAAAHRAMAAAMALPPAARWTEEQLVRQFMFGLAEAGIHGNAAFTRARASMSSLGDFYPPAPPSPEGGPELPPLPGPPKPAATVATSLGPTGDKILPPAKKPQVPL